MLSTPEDKQKAIESINSHIKTMPKRIIAMGDDDLTAHFSDLEVRLKVLTEEYHFVRETLQRRNILKVTKGSKNTGYTIESPNSSVPHTKAKTSRVKMTKEQKLIAAYRKLMPTISYEDAKKAVLGK